MVPTVVRLRMTPIQLTHAEREIRLRRLDEEMIVVVHQAVGVTEPAVAINDMGEQA